MSNKRKKSSKKNPSQASKREKTKGGLVEVERAGESEFPSTISAMAEVVQSYTPAAYIRNYDEITRAKFIRNYGSPFFAVHQFASSLLADGEPHRILLVGNTYFFGAASGKFLTLLSRALPDCGKLKFSLHQLRKPPTSRNLEKSVMSLPAQTIIQGAWKGLDRKDDDPPAMILVFTNGAFDPSTELALNAANAAASTRVVLCSQCEAEALTLIHLLRSHGIDATPPVAFAESAEETRPYVNEGFWFEIRNPRGLHFEKWNAQHLETARSVDALLETSFEDATEDVWDEFFGHFAKQQSVEVEGAECGAVVWFSHLDGIDVGSGKFFRRDSMDEDVKWTGETVEPSVLKSYPHSDSPEEVDARIRRQVWLGSVHASLVRKAMREKEAIAKQREAAAAELAKVREVREVREVPVPAVPAAARDDHAAPGVDAAAAEAAVAEPVQRSFDLSAGTLNVLSVSGRIGRGTESGQVYFEAAAKRLKSWLLSKGFDESALEASSHRTIGTGELHVETDAKRYWAFRFDDRSQWGSGATWRVEGTLINDATLPAIGIRLSQIRPDENAPYPSTGVPTPIAYIADKFGLSDAGAYFDKQCISFSGVAGFDALDALIRNPLRRQAVIVISSRQDSAVDASCHRLATRLVGLAHVCAIDTALASAMIDAYGKNHSVYGDAIRVYLPGFEVASNPLEHRVFPYLGKIIRKDVIEELVLIACIASLSGGDADERVPTFNQVQRMVADLRLERVRQRTEKLAASAQEDRDQQRSLVLELEKIRDQLITQLSEAEARAERLQVWLDDVSTERNALRSENHELRVRVDALTKGVALPVAAHSESEEIFFPDSWDYLEEWVAEYGKERIVLLDSAAKAARDSLFLDIPCCYQAMNYLAEHYYESKNRKSSDRSVEDRRAQALLDLGLIQSPVGNAIEEHRFRSDYEFAYDGRKLTMDLHLKRRAGMDQTRLFRLYFCYDEKTNKVVIGHMPTHLTNSKTRNA